MKVVTQKQFDISMDDLFKEFDMNNSGDVDDDDVRYLTSSIRRDAASSSSSSSSSARPSLPSCWQVRYLLLLDARRGQGPPPASSSLTRP